ncbi:MAG: hypothetical protein EP319_12605 [Deltaproteobacteria bacterium]|nr:MAG: hypothetical protein EP319_12605 [Deltaproteobacteria bacterium]
MNFKTLFILFSLLFSAFAFSQESDDLAETLHSRMEMRTPNLFEGAAFELVDVIPDQVQEVRQKALQELLDFATDYELFDLGFSYKLDERTYSVTNQQGVVVAYTVSVWISKNGEPMTRRFSILHRRVDGIYYVGRIVNYDLF